MCRHQPSSALTAHRAGISSETNPITPALNLAPKDREKEQTKSCSSCLGDAPSETLFRLTHSYSSLFLASEGEDKTCPGFSCAVQARAQHSLPAASSLFWDPQADTDELLAEGAATGTPLLHTWDTEHAPTSSLARFQGEKKKKLP